MNATIIVAIISATAVLLASALGSFLTKAKEREAEWRKQKLDHYKEMMAALSALVGTHSSHESRIRFANATNNIFLVGSPAVLLSLRDFLDATSDSSAPNHEENYHDKLLTALLFSIRDDLGIKPNKPDAAYSFKLWSGAPKPR